MNRCYHCGKTIIFGRQHTHHRGVAGGRWKKRAPKTQRVFKVNFQRVDVIENGKTERVLLCAKCIKHVKYDIAHGVRPFVTIAHYQAKNLSSEAEKKSAELPQAIATA